jgi:hypothetical protein
LQRLLGFLRGSLEAAGPRSEPGCPCRGVLGGVALRDHAATLTHLATWEAHAHAGHATAGYHPHHVLHEIAKGHRISRHDPLNIVRNSAETPGAEAATLTGSASLGC